MNPWGATVPVGTEAEFFNAARHTVFLLVEGGSDARFWLGRVDRRRCQVRAIGGRDAALDELGVVQSQGKSGFVAVLDADFDRLDGTLSTQPDVVWTDLHDLEAMLIASPALDKMLVDTGSQKKCDHFETSEKTSVRHALIQKSVWLGKLRWLSKRENLGLTFRKETQEGTFKYVDYQACCDRSSWGIDPKKVVKTVLNFSQRPELKVDDLLHRMGKLPEVDRWQLCVGRDLIGLLMVGLRSKLGNRNLALEDLQERLRLSFEQGHLENTEMYQALRAWEKRNPRYRILSW